MCIIPDDEPRQIVCTGEDGGDTWQPGFGVWEADDFGMDSEEPVGDGERLFVNRRLYDALQASLDAADARIRELEAAMARKTFPILNGVPARVDWQLVADHAQQAMNNHGQSIQTLANRGGLSWCELYAVLHNQRWEKIDTNEALIACRALEARYLAAITPPADLAERIKGGV